MQSIAPYLISFSVGAFFLSVEVIILRYVSFKSKALKKIERYMDIWHNNLLYNLLIIALQLEKRQIVDAKGAFDELEKRVIRPYTNIEHIRREYSRDYPQSCEKGVIYSVFSAIIMSVLSIIYFFDPIEPEPFFWLIFLLPTAVWFNGLMGFIYHIIKEPEIFREIERDLKIKDIKIDIRK